MPPSGAAPGDGREVADAPTLGLKALGSDADIALYGLQGVQTLTVPVPAGLTPGALNAVVELPPNVREGSISVTQDNRTVSRVDLPPDGAPISVPLAGAEIVDNALTVLLRSQLLPPDGYCLYERAIPLRLVKAAVSYTGREAAPRVVADFLPPVLERLTVFIPQTPSDAAVRLTTAVVARYGGQSTDVDIASLPGQEMAPPTPSGPFERNIVIREGRAAAVALQGVVGVPALLITGPANDLVNQTRLLSSDISRLALSKAVAGPIKSSPQLPANQPTIRDLGQPGVNATAMKPQVSVGLDQTRIGRPVKGVRVNLKGSYTPLPSSVGGLVVVSVGGQTVDRWPIDSTGEIDRWIDVPDSGLQRYTNLDVAVDISGNTGRCGEFQPVTLTIDGATTVDSSAAEPPAPLRFQSPASDKPKTFVVPSDPDFTALLNDPIGNGIEYLLAVPPTGRGASDALNVRFPTLYATGADIATLELEIRTTVTASRLGACTASTRSCPRADVSLRRDSRRAASSLPRGDPHGDSIEQLAYPGVEFGEVVAVGRFEHPVLERRRERREFPGVQQPPEQRWVFGTVDVVCGLDIECRGAPDVMQHRHHGGQFVALGQASGAQRGQAGIEPRHLTGVGGRTGSRGLQNPRMRVVDVP